MAKIHLKKPTNTQMCPVGFHIVSGHWRVCKSGTRTWVDTHLRKNKSSKTIYLPENIQVVFLPGLTPLHIKAIIAAESSFNPKAKAATSWGTGLMQVLKTALGPLRGEKRKNWREVRDHYIDVTHKDLEDPVINVAAGTRWLAHKYFLLRNHKNAGVKEVIRDYHSRDKAGEQYAEKVLNLYNSSK